MKWSKERGNYRIRDFFESLNIKSRKEANGNI